MKIPQEYEKYLEYIEAGKNIELKDEQTKIIVRAEHDCYKIIVDRGIIKTEKRKCDFAIVDETEHCLYFMELKGQIIDEALKQLLMTVADFEDETWLKMLINGRDKVVAGIVSPNRQQIPRGNNSHERELAKRLYAKCGKKPTNMFELIYYIKVIPKRQEASVNKKTRQIVCSNREPLLLNWLSQR